MTTTGAGGNS